MRAALHATAQARPGAALRAWREACVLGTLWGIVIWSLETLAFVFTRSDWRAELPLLLGLVLVWVSRGITLVLGSRWIAEHLKGVVSWLGLLALIVALALSWDGVHAAVEATRQLLGIPLPERQLFFFFNLWSLLVYGGPLVIAIQIDSRARRVRQRLDEAEVLRVRTLATLETERLAIARRRIDPLLLVQGLRELKLSLAAADGRAADLFEAMTGFLRTAMPGLRSGWSTVGDELDIFASRERLLALLRPGPPAMPTVLADPGLRMLALPAMRLVQALDELHAAGLDGACALSLAGDAGSPRLQLRGAAGADLPPRLRQVLEPWTVEVDGDYIVLSHPVTPSGSRNE